MRNDKKMSAGITLIALVITIIVLLILAGISVSMITGNQGIILNAEKAREQTEIANEKELIGTASIQAINENKFGIILQENLQKQLDSEFREENKAKVYEEEEDFLVLVENRLYKVEKQGNVKYQHLSNGEKVLTIQCVNSVGTILEEKQYITFKDTYSKQPPVVENYEIAEEGIITGDITESKTIQVLYYLVCNDDKTLIFSGLDASGNITTEENDIVSYMVGTGTTTYKNGMKSEFQSIKSNLYTPDTYNGKPVTKIGRYSLGKMSFNKIILSDLVEVTADTAFGNSEGSEITLGKNLRKIEVSSLKINNYTKVIFRCNQFTSAMACYFPGKAPLELDSNEDKFVLEDDVLYSKDKTIIYRVNRRKTGSFTTPSSVKTIFDYSFNVSKLSYVIISDSVTTVKTSAFQTTSINEIIIGVNVATADTSAFRTEGIIVIVNSPSIASVLTTSKKGGGIGENASIIYFNENITTIGSYITTHFTVVESDRQGYVKYVKNE